MDMGINMIEKIKNFLKMIFISTILTTIFLLGITGGILYFFYAAAVVIGLYVAIFAALGICSILMRFFIGIKHEIS